MGSKADLWPGMSRRYFDALKRYTGDLSDRLWLRDWTIVLAVDPSDDEEALAHINIVYGRRHATIWLGKKFAEEDEDTTRQALVHELIHCHLDFIEATLKVAVPKLIGSYAWAGIFETLHRDIEMTTDTLADAIAPYMPAFVKPG